MRGVRGVRGVEGGRSCAAAPVATAEDRRGGRTETPRQREGAGEYLTGGRGLGEEVTSSYNDIIE